MINRLYTEYDAEPTEAHSEALFAEVLRVSRTPRDICDNFVAVKQLPQNEQVHQDDPLRCQMGLDNGNRSWQRRTIFRMAACFFGLPSTGSCRCQRQDPAYPSRRDFLTPEMIQKR